MQRSLLIEKENSINDDYLNENDVELLAFAGSTKRTKRKRYHKQSWSL
jgi:hypothetical protein